MENRRFSLRKTAGFTPVLAALAGNAFVTAIKFAGYFLSGSSALFSEAIHSFADTINQALFNGRPQTFRQKAER